MLIIYGCKPGSTVTFPLKIDPPRVTVASPDGTETVVERPKPEITGDAVVKVTARVPNEAERREVIALLGASVSHDSEGKLHFKNRLQVFESWRSTAIKKFVQRVDDLKIADPSAADDPEKVLWIRTPDDLLAHADDAVLTAIADTILDRVKLFEAVSGKKLEPASPAPAEEKATVQ